MSTCSGGNNLNQYWVKRKEKNIRKGGKYKVNVKNKEELNKEEHKQSPEASITVLKKIPQNNKKTPESKI